MNNTKLVGYLCPLIQKPAQSHVTTTFDDIHVILRVEGVRTLQALAYSLTLAMFTNLGAQNSGAHHHSAANFIKCSIHPKPFSSPCYSISWRAPALINLALHLWFFLTLPDFISNGPMYRTNRQSSGRAKQTDTVQVERYLEAINRMG